MGHANPLKVDLAVPAETAQSVTVAPAAPAKSKTASRTETAPRAVPAWIKPARRKRPVRSMKPRDQTRPRAVSPATLSPPGLGSVLRALPWCSWSFWFWPEPRKMRGRMSGVFPMKQSKKAPRSNEELSRPAGRLSSSLLLGAFLLCFIGNTPDIRPRIFLGSGQNQKDQEHQGNARNTDPSPGGESVAGLTALGLVWSRGFMLRTGRFLLAGFIHAGTARGAVSVRDAVFDLAGAAGATVTLCAVSAGTARSTLSGLA